MALFGFLKKNTDTGNYKDDVVYSPVSGTFVPIEKVEDPAFSQKIMGDGFGVEPSDGHFMVPISGELITVFPTKHAFGIKAAGGQEILIHVGIDTVNLNGKGFSSRLKEGQKVHAGEHLVDVDLNVVREAGYKCTVIVVVTSGEEFETIKATDQLKALDPVLEFKSKA